jgi:elongation factor 1-gamma
LIPGLTDPAPYNRDAVEAGKKSSLTLLAKLETILKDKVWLVGESPTLADIFVAVVISRGLQWVLGRTWRDGHPAIMAHFERTREWEPVHRTVTKFELIDEETKNIQPDKVV